MLVVYLVLYFKGFAAVEMLRLFVCFSEFCRLSANRWTDPQGRQVARMDRGPRHSDIRHSRRLGNCLQWLYQGETIPRTAESHRGRAQIRRSAGRREQPNLCRRDRRWWHLPGHFASLFPLRMQMWPCRDRFSIVFVKNCRLSTAIYCRPTAFLFKATIWKWTSRR